MPLSSATPTTLFLVEPPGLIRASSGGEGEGGMVPQTGRSVEEALGVDWATLQAIARTTKVIESRSGRLHVEALIGADGGVAAVLVRPESGQQTSISVAPPSSSRFDRGLKFLVGKDVATRAAVDLALRFAKTSLPILIGAEAGSGADVLARAIHAASARARAAFVHVGAATVPKSAAESLLFSGGAPTPTAAGVLFVEDVHELDFGTQMRLARELDRGVLADVQLVCSAPPDVRDRVARGAFARELYTLVRGSSVVLPPLREREDLPLLVRQILTELGAADREVTGPALDALKSYWWPGNLSELWACLEHAIVVADKGGPLDRGHLPEGLLAPSPVGNEGLRRTSERAAVEEALRVAQGNVSAAAKRLGVARSTLYRLMQRHSLGK